MQEPPGLLVPGHMPRGKCQEACVVSQTNVLDSMSERQLPAAVQGCDQGLDAASERSQAPGMPHSTGNEQTGRRNHLQKGSLLARLSRHNNVCPGQNATCPHDLQYDPDVSGNSPHCPPRGVCGACDKVHSPCLSSQAAHIPLERHQKQEGIQMQDW